MVSRMMIVMHKGDFLKSFTVMKKTTGAEASTFLVEAYGAAATSRTRAYACFKEFQEGR